MQTLRPWPLWVKVTAGIGAVLGFVVAASISGVIGNRADAFIVWALPFLFCRVTLPVWILVLGGLGAAILGMGVLFLLQQTRPALFADSLTPAAATSEQEGSTSVRLATQQQVTAALDNLLEEMAPGGTSFLPQFLGRLQLIFDRLGRADDAAWCQEEVNGYPEDKTPEYRYADATVTWRSGGATTSTALTRRPPDQSARVPLNGPVGTLVRNSQSGWREPTGKTTQDLVGQEVREVILVSPEAVRGVLRRIQQEAYRRAMAARKAIEST